MTDEALGRRLLAQQFGLLALMALLALLQTDDFARRLVATVDKLGGEQASARLWPLNPAQGRFTDHSGVTPRS